MRNMQRLFIAIPFTPGIKKNLRGVQAELEPKLPGWRWVEDTNFHLTLKFLGDVRIEDVTEFCGLANAAVAELAPFEFRLEQLGVFPKPQAPRVLWVGVGGDIEPIHAMAQRLEAAADELGIPVEAKGYHPHVTLARAKKGATIDADALAAQFERYRRTEIAKVFCREIAVYHSMLRPDGPLYEILSTAPLVAPAS